MLKNSTHSHASPTIRSPSTLRVIFHIRKVLFGLDRYRCWKLCVIQFHSKLRRVICLLSVHLGCEENSGAEAACETLHSETIELEFLQCGRRGLKREQVYWDEIALAQIYTRK